MDETRPTANDTATPRPAPACDCEERHGHTLAAISCLALGWLDPDEPMPRLVERRAAVGDVARLRRVVNRLLAGPSREAVLAAMEAERAAPQ